MLLDITKEPSAKGSTRTQRKIELGRWLRVKVRAPIFVELTAYSHLISVWPPGSFIFSSPLPSSQTAPSVSHSSHTHALACYCCCRWWREKLPKKTKKKKENTPTSHTTGEHCFRDETKLIHMAMLMAVIDTPDTTWIQCNKVFHAAVLFLPPTRRAVVFWFGIRISDMT